ncbi:MAG: T9SS type A sorting domain-containing protein, partial [Bacteroidota bacterium]
KYFGYTAYGHGGDISYSTQALYFPELDISIVVATNDARVLSWNLIPTVRALLRVYLDYESAVTSVKPLSSRPIDVTVFPNPLAGDLGLRIHAPIAMQEVSIALYSMDGKQVWSSTNDLSAGQNELTFPIAETLPSGVYVLQIQAADVVLAQQSVFKQ